MFYPGSRIRSEYLFIPDPDPESRIQGVKKHRIPDPGGKKAPDPGSGSATLLRYRGNKDCCHLVKLEGNAEV
jgi:hypothetical protein